jgi:LysM repeat protein
MDAKRIALLAVTVALALPGTALADDAHVVAPGETLTSVAAADGLSVSALAAENGLSDQAELKIGQVIQIPPQGSATEATSTGSGAPTTSATSSTVGRLYMVQPGDSLSAIAARIGITPAHLAAVNSLRLDGVLLAGSRLMLPGSSVGSTGYVDAGDVSRDTGAATPRAPAPIRCRWGTRSARSPPPTTPPSPSSPHSTA